MFVDISPLVDAGSEYVTAYLPPPTFHGPTDGNCYVQVGGPARPLLRHDRYDEVDGAGFANLDDYRGSTHHIDSRTIYGPGFERNSVAETAPFVSLAADGAPQATDDLRLAVTSQATTHGIDPDTAGITDTFAAPGPWHMGCYPPGAADGLNVGVDGARRYPDAPN